jgi:hypothetical protein
MHDVHDEGSAAPRRLKRHGVVAALGLGAALLVGATVPTVSGAQSTTASTIERTEWQMFIPPAVVGKLDPVPNFYVDWFKKADIPKQDAAWVPAPDPDTIKFDGSKGVGGENGSRLQPLTTYPCEKSADYTYFQTFITPPAGTTVNDFTVDFVKIDDLAKISIFNSKRPDGDLGQTGIVSADANATQTQNLASELVPGEANRVVITQLDYCAPGNNLGSATITLNGEEVGADPDLTIPEGIPQEDATQDEDPAATTSTTTAPEPEEDAPICPETPPSNVYGDVHVRTPDSLIYDFQFMGDFLIAESADGDVTLQTQMEPWEVNPEVSVNTKAAINVAGDTLVFDVDPATPFTLNGEPTAMPTEDLALPNGGSISVGDPASGFRDNLAITWPDDSTQAVVRVSKRPFLDVGLCRLDQTKEYEGLIGNLNGDPEDDMAVRDGDPVAQPASVEDLAEFGDSWRVAPDDSLFEEPMPEAEHVTPTKTITIEDLPEDALADAEEVCASMDIEDPLAQHQCAYDVAATGEDGFAESAEVQGAAVEALPESAPAPVAAVEGIAPVEIALAGTDAQAPSDQSTDDDGGLNLALVALMGAAGIGLIAAIAVLIAKNKKTPPPGTAGPTTPAGPAGPAGPVGSPQP